MYHPTSPPLQDIEQLCCKGAGRHLQYEKSHDFRNKGHMGAQLPYFFFLIIKQQY